MSGNRTKQETAKLPVFLPPLLWGMAVACAVCALTLILMSLLLTWRDIPPKAIDPMTTAAISLSCCAGGYFSARRMREKGMMMGMALSAALFLILIVCSLPLGGPYSALMAVKLTAMLLAGALGGVLGVNRKVHHSSKRR